ncbi:MAG: phosphoribosylformylglycinamidine cyclo-ligase [Thermoplasmatota archaeon]
MTDPGRKDEGATYAGSGVDIVKEGESIRSLVSALKYRRTDRWGPVDIGAHFTGIIDFGDHYLSLCTDGVGSKIKIAETIVKWDTVGIDCIAMNVNDMICIGAEPIAFVDYIATENPTAHVLGEIGKGLNEGARQSNITIIGGETATLPEIVNGLDLAGTCLGAVRKDQVINGSRTRVGDLIIGLRSSGLHSNGFTLVRRVLSENDLSLISPLEEVASSKVWKLKKRFPIFSGEVERWIGEEGSSILGEILLNPTKIYVREIMELLENVDRSSVHGMANITGGGIRNICRIREDVGYSITDPPDVPPVFRMIQVLGSIDEKEMYQTFNMGIGFALIIDPDIEDDVMGMMGDRGGSIIGKVTDGKGLVIPDLGIEFEGYV